MSPYTERREALRKHFEASKVDSLLVSDEINVRYLTGFTGDSSVLWIGHDFALMLSDGRYTAQLNNECGDLKQAIRPPQTPMAAWICSTLEGCGQTVGFEASDVSVATFQAIREIVGVVWKETQGMVETLRMKKDSSEIASIRKSVDIAQQALAAIGLHPQKPSDAWRSMTERELAYALEAEIRSLGGEGTSFEPIIAVNEAGALPHYHPSDRPLGGAKTLLVDWGANVDGYASDMTRTFHDGKPSDRFGSAYQAVLEAHLAAAAALKPGVAAQDIDETARSVLRQAGFGDYFSHALGHGFGLRIHEAPRLGGGIEMPLEPNMVVTIEPGVYLDGEFGIRLEDDYLITEQGFELLGQTPDGGILASSLPKGLEEVGIIG